MDNALVIDKDFPEAAAFRCFFLARKLQEIDKPQAIGEYEKAIKLCPDIGTFWNNIGVMYFGMNQIDKAIEQFKKAIEISGDFFAYNSLCSAYVVKRQYALGVEAGQEAVKRITTTINPGIAYNNLALCFSGLGKNSEAIEIINKALALSPNDPDFIQTKKIILFGQSFTKILYVLW